MKTRPLTVIVILIGLVSMLSCSAWAAPSAEQMDLSRQLAKQLFPKAKLLDVEVQLVPPEKREAFKKIAEEDFDYSKIEEPVAKLYASKFSTKELKSLLKFQKKKSAQLAMTAVSRLPGQKKPETIPPNPPADTYETRMAEAEKIATSMTEKELVMETLKFLLADQPKEKSEQILAMVEKTYENPQAIKAMRMSKAQDFAAMMTTPQLKEVAVFYSDPIGKKFLKTNPMVGKIMKDVLTQQVDQAVKKMTEQELKESDSK